MTKTELIEALAAALGLPKDRAAGVLDELCVQVHGELARGGEVVLPGIGKLSVRDREASEGRNPRTGERIAIAARRVARFAPAKALRDRLNPPAPSVPRRASGGRR